MHVEPGYVASSKVVVANAGAIGVFVWGYRKQLQALPSEPLILLKTVLASALFTLFMQSFHVSVGPSELHFVGAMAMYLTLGFTPTLLGFGVGLLFQGLMFDPGDLYHLGVNSLSLMLPLISVHFISGKKFFDQKLALQLSWTKIVKLDAMYYAGVTSMVGFWLIIGDVPTPFASWAAFAASYLTIVAFEPVATYVTLKTLKSVDSQKAVEKLSVVGSVSLK